MKLFQVTDWCGVKFYVVSPSLARAVERFNYNVKEQTEEIVEITLIAETDSKGRTHLEILEEKRIDKACIRTNDAATREALGIEPNEGK